MAGIADFLEELLAPTRSTTTTPWGPVSTQGSPRIVDLASGVLGLVGAGSAQDRLKSVYSANQFDQLYQQLSQQLATLSGQLADSNNPEFVNRVKQRTDQIMQQYEQALRMQQAREGARYSRTGMGNINPERRDEALARSLAQFRVQAEAQARAEVTKELLAAAGVKNNAAATAGNVANQDRSRQAAGANAQNQYGAAKAGGAAGLLAALAPAIAKGIDFKKLSEAIFGAAGGAGGGLPTAAQLAARGPEDYRWDDIGAGGPGVYGPMAGALPGMGVTGLPDFGAGAGTDYSDWVAPPALPELPSFEPPPLSLPPLPDIDYSNLGDFSAGGYDDGGYINTVDWGGYDGGAYLGDIDYF